MKSYTLAERRDMILNGNPVKSILTLSFPTIIMSIITAFIPLTDGLFLNNFASPEIASAVGYSQPYINILIGFSLGLGAAAMSIIGQANGQGDIQKVKYVSLQIFLTAFVFALIMVPLALVVAIIAKSFAIEQISGYVWLYISMNSIYLPMLFMASIFNSIKNATGQPEATLIRVLILLFLKIIFNSIFLTWLKLDIVGASLATIISYLLLSIWMYYDLFLKKSELKFEVRGFSFDTFLIKQLFTIAVPSMISYALVNLGFVLINIEVNNYGVNVLVAQSIASNVNSLCFTLPAAIGTTITVMVSMNVSVNNIKKAKQSLYIGCVISLIISTAIIILIWPNIDFIVRLFQHENIDIINVATGALKIYTLSILGYGIFMVVQGAFIGLGSTKPPLFFGLFRMWLVRYIFIIFTKHILLEYSVFWGNLVSNYITAILFFAYIMSVKWQAHAYGKR